ncbi:MAG: class I SAM-dependent methyltransferase [Acidimicrobiia bacterium]|jgi:SAM-dependent methyltransferase
MSNGEQARWDERYALGDYRPSVEPSPVIEEVAGHVGVGRALVLACGAGRNALYLASRGFQVDAVDISTVAIDMARTDATRRGLSVQWHVGDVAEFDMSEGCYDVITMIRYTNRSIWGRLVTGLSEDGWLAMGQHLRTRHQVAGPSDEYRLRPGELLQAFGGLRVIRYAEEYGESPTSGKMVATTTLLACKGDPGW